MYQIQDILHLTNVSRKQVNNRIRKLKNKYPNLIKGGGRGRGGKYLIHPLMIPFLIRLNEEISLTNSEKEQWIRKQQLFYESISNYNNLDTFSKVEWDWFCCFRPPNEYDIQSLIDLIPKSDATDLAYFSIHRQEDKLHIHFVLRTNMNKNEILNSVKTICDKDCELFDRTKRTQCYTYLSDPHIRRNGGQVLVDWGYRF